MKKYFWVLMLALALALTLTACGGGNRNGNADPGTDPALPRMSRILLRVNGISLKASFTGLLI